MRAISFSESCNPGNVSVLALFPSERRPMPVSARSEGSPPGLIAQASSDMSLTRFRKSIRFTYSSVI